MRERKKDFKFFFRGVGRVGGEKLGDDRNSYLFIFFFFFFLLFFNFFFLSFIFFVGVEKISKLFSRGFTRVRQYREVSAVGG